MKLNKKSTSFFVYTLIGLLMVAGVFAAQSPVDFGAAANFSVVAQTLISDATPAASYIVGDVSIDPAAGSLIHDISCTNIDGNIYDNNAGYTGGYDANVSCLITNATKTLAVQQAMVIAYNDARGRTGTNITEAGSGEIGGMTLYPGLYKWSTPVTISTNVTLDCQGNASEVFIFQIAQTLTLSNGMGIILAGGCREENIFWQTDTAVIIGTTALFNGNILAGTAITLNTGATLNGRAFAQTAVTMGSNAVTIPTAFVCTPDWSCIGYGSCLENDTQVCNEVTDLNTCGEVYGGDYSEFDTQVCDFCTPAWGCSSFEDCDGETRVCLDVEDSNLCGELFAGNLGDYDESCSTGYVPEYETGDLPKLTIDVIGTFLLTLIGLIGLFVLVLLVMWGIKHARKIVRN